MRIGAWEVVDWIATTRLSRIGRARNAADGRTALLKVSLDGEAAFRREFELTSSAQIPGVFRPLQLLTQDNATAMLLPDSPSAPLQGLIEGARLAGPESLRIAVELARALDGLHAADLVYGDLRPSNVLYDTATQTPWIADLSSASEPGHPLLTSGAPSTNDHWAYVAPEQTGMMNRVVDHRADLYALGVLLYRMLTGRLPFDARDPLEWVHCHVARTPRAPAQVAPDVPDAVSDIVMKLLAKAAEDRYQSAQGLQADLLRALAAWESGDVEPFPLAAHDASARLHVAQKVYGRAAESAILVDAFARVVASRRPELVLLTGPAGAGKSALAHELLAPLVAMRGSFVAAKFDRHQRDTPYSGLVRAFDTLIRQALAQSEEQLAKWRRELVDALEGNGRLMQDLVPALKLLIGPQPPVPEVAWLDAENRLRRVFLRFIAVFARADHPLLLFLDDLQWADPASLLVVGQLVTSPAVGALLLVGAYRDDEINPGHPIEAMLDAIRKQSAPIARIPLGPLGRADVAALVADTLMCSPADAAALAEPILEKTSGNPFFVIQFLTELHSQRLLEFDAVARRWRWDVESIRNKAHTDNVVQLMVGKLRRLPSRTQRVLERAACIGTSVDTSLLAAALERAPAEVADDLADATRASLVLRSNGTYRFVHNRVQEAAYEMIPDDERTGAHLRIGRALRGQVPPEQLKDRVFVVVNQLNLAAPVITDGAEIADLCSLNLLAGREAKSAAAFESARFYLRRAAALWPGDGWAQRCDETAALNLDLAECEIVTGNPAAADALLDTVLAHARTSEARARACRLRLKLLPAGSRLFDTLREGLALFGIPFADTEERDAAALQAQQRDLLARLGGRALADLVDAPPLSDPRIRQALALLLDACSAVYIVQPTLFAPLVMKAMALTVEHGNCEESCVVYAYYARVLVSVFDDIDAAVACSDLSLRLNARLGDAQRRGPLLLWSTSTAHFWREPFGTALPLLAEAFAACMRVGDLLAANFTASLAPLFALAGGSSVDEFLDLVNRYGTSLGPGMREGSRLLGQGYMQFARCLKGQTRSLNSIEDDRFDETAFITALAASGAVRSVGIYAVLRQTLAFLDGRHDESLAWADQAARHLAPVPASVIEVTHHLYRALAIAARLARADAAAPAASMQALREACGTLQRWSAICPANFESRRALVAAELARVEGRDGDAETSYERAIAAAREQGFVKVEAVACERAAAFWRERGIARIADTYLREARACYVRWGSPAKAAQLDAAYPQLKRATPTEAGPRDLDTLAVVKASQAISSELDLDHLVEALLRIVLESAGAQTGALYFVDGERLVLSATAQADQGGLDVSIVRDSATQPQPATILNYVRRTHEQVLLGDARRPGPFAADPYVMQRRPKSLLCLPLLRRSAPVGVLYLENNLVTDAFTPERVAMVGVLAAQAAISVEIARLYTALRDENAERRRAEQAARDGQARIERMLATNTIGIAFTSAQGRLTEANEAFLQMTGYSREDLVAGRLNTRAMTPPDYAAARERAHAELLRAGRHTPYEQEFLRKDGTRVPVLVSGTLIEGAPAQGVIFALDLTVSRQAQADREARKVAEAANEAKSQFLANMSHELRTPLNGILGFAQILLMDKGLDKRQSRGLSVIKEGGEHLLALINDILDLAKIEAGRFELAVADVGLAAFLANVRDVIRVRADQKHLQFVCDVASDLPAAVRADEQRLRQVLLNLLSNAVKFTDAGEVRLAVRLATPGRLRFEVRDTGIGIAPEQVEQLFRPFAQVGDTKRRSGGTGLGLAISQQIVRKMGGEIRVDSEVGAGSTFWFEADLPSVTRAPVAASAPRHVTGYLGPRRKVLVVDDLPYNRAVLAALLAPIGFDVLQAATGREALDLAETQHPDLILMDLVMPDLDGLETTRHLRSKPDLRSIPLIAVSASATAADVEHSIAAGADAFLPKPIDIHALVAQVGALLKITWQYEAGTE